MPDSVGVVRRNTQSPTDPARVFRHLQGLSLVTARRHEEPADRPSNAKQNANSSDGENWRIRAPVRTSRSRCIARSAIATPADTKARTTGSWPTTKAMLRSPWPASRWRLEARGAESRLRTAGPRAVRSPGRSSSSRSKTGCATRTIRRSSTLAVGANLIGDSLARLEYSSAEFLRQLGGLGHDPIEHDGGSLIRCHAVEFFGRDKIPSDSHSVTVDASRPGLVLNSTNDDAVQNAHRSPSVVVSFAVVTELRFGALKAGWGELRRRGFERDLTMFTVFQPDDDLMHRCAEPSEPSLKDLAGRMKRIAVLCPSNLRPRRSCGNPPGTSRSGIVDLLSPLIRL